MLHDVRDACPQLKCNPVGAMRQSEFIQELSRQMNFHTSSARMAAMLLQKARIAKWLQDIVYSYLVVLTIKMKLKATSTFYLQLSRQSNVQLLFQNTCCITIYMLRCHFKI